MRWAGLAAIIAPGPVAVQEKSRVLCYNQRLRRADAREEKAWNRFTGNS